jgi:hypothetical protein
MSGTDRLFLAEDQQYQQQQQLQNTNSVITIDSLSFSLGNMSDILLNNLAIRNSPHVELTTLTYTIIFGLICACLCFLTITGNLLVLITFRRMRTVSIRISFCHIIADY